MIMAPISTFLLSSDLPTARAGLPVGPPSRRGLQGKDPCEPQGFRGEGAPYVWVVVKIRGPFFGYPK